MNIHEEMILQNLKNDFYDGTVGTPYSDDHGRLIRYCIEQGIPRIYERAPTPPLFHKKDGTCSYGKEKIISEYLMDEDKLLFFRQEGFRMHELHAWFYSVESPDELSHLTGDEKLLLNALHIEDEFIGRTFYDNKKNIISFQVTDGILQKCMSKPQRRRIDGHLKAVAYSDPIVVREYCTQKDKLVFVMRFGHYTKNKLLQSYSKKSGFAIYFKEFYGEPEVAKIPPKSFPRASYPKPKDECDLLEKLRSHKLDGRVGDIYPDNGYGTSSWFEIFHGVPSRIKLGPGSKVFNGKENERLESEPKIAHQWKTDDEKIWFLRQYGFLMDDPDVKAYSAKYKGKF